MDLGKPLGFANDDGVTPSPAATWFDDTQGLFISILEIDDSFESNEDNNVGDCALYQILNFPKGPSQEVGAEKLEETKKNCIPIHVRLPRSLGVVDTTSTVEEGNNSSNNNNNSIVSEITTTSSPRRLLPLLVRISLDGKLLAMQFSLTVVRIAVIEEQNERLINSKHWTIDVSKGDPPNPASSTPFSLPNIRKKKGNGGKILPGGVIWSDHGGSSQELMMVTNKAVYCYKVSLRRNQMTLTHSFPICNVSAMWWEPVSRSLVVGSLESSTTATANNEGEHNDHDETLFLHTFYLQFAPIGQDMKLASSLVLRLPRLELPPPERFPQFSIEHCPKTEHHVSTTSVNRHHHMMPSQIAVVNLYDQAYLVGIRFSCGNKIILSLYRLDRHVGPLAVNSCLEVILPDNCEVVLDDFRTLLVVVLDNLLCISFRRSKVHVFLEIAEVSSGNCYVVQKMASEEDNLCSSDSVSFLPPSFVRLKSPSDGRDVVFPLELNLQRLASAIVTNAYNVSILLRRSHHAHKILLSQLPEIVNIKSIIKRQNLINHIANAYAGDPTALDWDWNTTVPLIFRCALLPPGSEFRYCDSDSDTAWLFHNDISATQRPNNSSILFQKEILEHVLLVKASEALKAFDDTLLRSVGDVAVGFMGALDRCQSLPCPALECLVVAILWRLGCDNEILQVLCSRSRKRRTLRTKSLNCNRTTINLSCDMFSSMIMAITSEVEFGSGATPRKKNCEDCQQTNLLNLIVRESLALTSSRSLNPAYVIKHLLLQKRLSDAISVCSKIASESNINLGDPITASGRALVEARMENKGEDFFRVAVDCAKLSANIVDRYRALQRLYDFLSFWDPKCLQVDMVEETQHSNKGVVMTRERRHLLQKMKCRPSWLSLQAIEGEVAKNTSRPSFLARVFPEVLDDLFHGTENYKFKVHVQRLFGYDPGLRI